MKVLTLILLFIISGCINTTDLSLVGMKKQEPKFSGEIIGNYSALARCVVDTMKEHESRSIRSLQYNLRVYPDIERSEIQAHLLSLMWPGVFYAFHLELNKTAPNVSNAVIKGLKYEAGEALKALQGCADKK